MVRENKREEKIIISAATEPEEEIGESVSAYTPIQLEPARKREDIRLCNEYIEHYHPLGYKRPFGSHQRYFIRSQALNRNLGCMLFSAFRLGFGRAGSMDRLEQGRTQSKVKLHCEQHPVFNLSLGEDKKPGKQSVIVSGPTSAYRLAEAIRI